MKLFAIDCMTFLWRKLGGCNIPLDLFTKLRPLLVLVSVILLKSYLMFLEFYDRCRKREKECRTCTWSLFNNLFIYWFKHGLYDTVKLWLFHELAAIAKDVDKYVRMVEVQQSNARMRSSKPNELFVLMTTDQRLYLSFHVCLLSVTMSYTKCLKFRNSFVPWCILNEQ